MWYFTSSFSTILVALIACYLYLYSSCDWLVAGSDICRPKLRLRIVPSPTTLATLVARDDQSLKYKKHLRYRALNIYIAAYIYR